MKGVGDRDGCLVGGGFGVVMGGEMGIEGRKIGGFWG
jgi:hypothetical protein